MSYSRVQPVLRAYAISIGLWTALSLLTGWNYRIFDQSVHIDSSLRGMIYLAESRGLAYAVLTPVIFYVVRRHPLGLRRSSWPLVFYTLGLIPFMVSYSVIRWAVLPTWDPGLQQYVPRSSSGPLGWIYSGFADQITIYIAIVVGAHAYEYFERIRKQQIERYEYQQALAVSELQALKMQLHPHFLFNTLHGISTLIDTDQTNAKAMVVKLSGLLRTALRYSGADLISLREELSFIREYLDLESMRLGPRLKVESFVDPAAEPMLVPQMILQPLVENAIQHGVAGQRGDGWIELFARKTGNLLELKIRNSASGGRPEGTAVGLRNTQARLKHLYADEASLSFVIGDDHVAVTVLKFPALGSNPLAADAASSAQRKGETELRAEVGPTN
jgi:two-component system, LytTR family, sensor kinase